MNTLSFIQTYKIISIVRNAGPDDLPNIAQALYDGGIRLLEITLNSPQAIKLIEKLSKEFQGKMQIGAGSVLDPESARAALSAGATYIISPTLNVETIKLTKRYGAVSIPGAFTPTEILTAYENGADIVKVFPIGLGPTYIKDIKGPLPQIPLLPTGGITLENIQDYLQAGAVGCGIGSALVNTRVKMTDSTLVELTERARKFVSVVQSFDSLL